MRGTSVSIIKHHWNSVSQLCPTLCDPWTAARQASLSIVNSQSPPKPMSIESVMPSNHLILCRPLLLLPSVFPSIRVFSNESALLMRWPKYWSFSISPSKNTQDWSPLGWTVWISLQSKGLSRVFSSTAEISIDFKRINSSGLSFLYRWLIIGNKTAREKESSPTDYSLRGKGWEKNNHLKQKKIFER